MKILNKKYRIYVVKHFDYEKIIENNNPKNVVIIGILLKT